MTIPAALTKSGADAAHGRSAVDQTSTGGQGLKLQTAGLKKNQGSPLDDTQKDIGRGRTFTPPINHFDIDQLPMPGLKVQVDGLRNKSPERRGSITAQSPAGWWSHRDLPRPWREKDLPARKRSVPPEQEDRWLYTRRRVGVAVRSVLGDVLDITHEALIVASETLHFAPVPGLEEVARVLLDIWEAMQLVETNRLACLRLTERCADILLAVREEIYEAGDDVGEELQVPLEKLTISFQTVLFVLQKQVRRPFLKRYLKRDEIFRSIEACDAALSDALGLFSIRIQIRTLRQLQQNDHRAREENEHLLSSVLEAVGDVTPKQRPVALPMESVASGDTLKPSPSNITSEPHLGTSGTTTPVQASSSQQLTPQDVQEHIQALVTKQHGLDRELDMQDLRQLMRTALATSNDADMIRVLQVSREEMPEAIKAMQRALEQAVEVEHQKNDVLTAFEEAGIVVRGMEAQAQQATAATMATGMGGPALQGRLEGLQLITGEDEHRVFADQPSHIMSAGASSHATSSSTTDQGTASNWSWVTARDELDREFIEGGIDAMRRLSKDQEINLPSWTITRYEVDLEEKIGIGNFSDVYKGVWNHYSVAVKVLAPSTPAKLFLREMSVWRNLRHANVLPLLGASSVTGDRPWFFVSPYLKNGNMVTFLKNLQPGIPYEPLRMIREISKGMEYLHKQGILHSDLKGTNVLIDEDYHCVIADFGQSELKSEAYKISGTPPPHGTFRWKAPELLDINGMGRHTAPADVYAFAIVCVEVLTRGALPWANMDDEQVRRMVLEEDKRPPYPYTIVTNELSALIQACWVRDPAQRPPFKKIVKDIKAMGGGTLRESPLPGAYAKLWEVDRKRRKSPDMRPPLPPLPSTLTIQRLPGQLTSSTPSSPEDSFTENSSRKSSWHSEDIHMPVPHPYPGSSSSTSPTTRTSRSSTDASAMAMSISRFTSPPPDGEICMQRKDESRYRLYMQHSFHPSLVLPLWSPSPIKLGAVGYHKKQEGSFVTLLNSYDPVGSSEGRVKGMGSIRGFGAPLEGSQHVDKRTATQKSLGVLQQFNWIKSLTDGMASQSPARRYSFQLRAGHKCSYLVTENTIYRYIENIDVPKKWLSANIDRILQIYGQDEEHPLQKEDICLVIGTLDTPDWGLFVGHNNPDGQVHFDVTFSPRNGQPWGTFSTDAVVPVEGPSYTEDMPAAQKWSKKVSESRVSKPWDTVLLARLRFKPDNDVPTAL